jgi:hypothetical protein
MAIWFLCLRYCSTPLQFLHVKMCLNLQQYVKQYQFPKQTSQQAKGSSNVVTTPASYYNDTNFEHYSRRLWFYVNILTVTKKINQLMEAEIPRSTILTLSCLREHTLVYDSRQPSIGVDRLISVNTVGFTHFGTTLHQVSLTPSEFQNCKILLSIWLQRNVVPHSCDTQILIIYRSSQPPYYAPKTLSPICCSAQGVSDYIHPLSEVRGYFLHRPNKQLNMLNNKNRKI